MMRRLLTCLCLAGCSIPTSIETSQSTPATIAVGSPELVDYTAGAYVYEVCVGTNESVGAIRVENATEGTLLMPTEIGIVDGPGDAGSGCPTKTSSGEAAVGFARFRWQTSLGTAHVDVRYVNGGIVTAPLDVELDGSRFLGYDVSVDKVDQTADYLRMDVTLKYKNPSAGDEQTPPGVTYTILTLPMLDATFPTDSADMVTGLTGGTTLVFAPPSATTQIYVKPQGGDLLFLKAVDPITP